VAAGRTEDVADEENVHLWILARERRFEIRDARFEMRDGHGRGQKQILRLRRRMTIHKRAMSV